VAPDAPDEYAPSAVTREVFAGAASGRRFLVGGIMRKKPPTRDSYGIAAELERSLRHVRQQFDQELARVDDERACMLFDAARQVLDGLITTFEDYQRTAGVWRDGEASSPH
jgi:hypothetical protein